MSRRNVRIGSHWRRPPTRVYECNYTLGEQYYKDVVAGLDKAREERQQQSSSATTNASTERSRSSALNDSDYDLKSARKQDALSEEVNEYRRAARTAAAEAEDDFESRISAIKRRQQERASRSEDDFSDRVLESFGVKQSDDLDRYVDDRLSSIRNRKVQIDDLEGDDSSAGYKSSVQRRTVRSSLRSSQDQDSEESSGRSKFVSLNLRNAEETEAEVRARRSKNRLAEIENDLQALEERQKARRSLFAEAESTLAAASADQSASQSRIASRSSSQAAAASSEESGSSVRTVRKRVVRTTVRTERVE